MPGPYFPLPRKAEHNIVDNFSAAGHDLKKHDEAVFS
jgi:hypothetical protein